MVRLLITDIGGVLVKTDEAIVSSIKKVFSDKGIVGGDEKGLMANFGVSLYDYILGYLPFDKKDMADECYEEFKKIYPYDAVSLMKVFDGVNETLNLIKEKGIKISVLSCMIRREVDVNLSLVDFKDFDIVYSLDDYNFKRPNPHGLLDIAKRLEVEPKDCIYVGDTYNDVRMAKNAGMISVAVASGMPDLESLENEGPDYLINSFKDIINIIEKL